MIEHPHADLSAYLDGELDPTARAAVDGHLRACGLCRSHVAQLRATTALLRALPDPVPTRRLTPRLGVPAWLAPMRTLMTLASGAAAFLFIASAVLANIGTLATGGAATTALESSRDRAAGAPAPAAGAAAPTQGINAPTSPFAAFSTASGAPERVVTDSAQKRSDASPTAAPSAVAAVPPAAPPQDAQQNAERPRPQLASPWLWLALTVVCGAIAYALQRRLRSA